MRSQQGFCMTYEVMLMS